MPRRIRCVVRAKKLPLGRLAFAKSLVVVVRAWHHVFQVLWMERRRSGSAGSFGVQTWLVGSVLSTCFLATLGCSTRQVTAEYAKTMVATSERSTGTKTPSPVSATESGNKKAIAISAGTNAAGSSTNKPGEILYVVARGPFSEFYPLGGRTVVASRGLTPWIDGDDLVFDTEAKETRAQAEWWEVKALDGIWRKDAWMVALEPATQNGSSKLFNWTGNRWRLFRRSSQGSVFVGTSPWVGRRRLALISQLEATSGMEFVVVEGDARTAVPIASRPAEQADQPEHKYCQSTIFGGSLLSFPSGEVFVAGRVCWGLYAQGGYAVEMWTASSRKGKVVTIQETAPSFSFWEGSNLFGPDPRNVYVAYGHYLGHFDGEKWREVEGALAGDERISKASLLQDGTLWLLLESEQGRLHLRKRAPGAAWVDQVTQVPDEFVNARVVSAWERDKGDLWVIVNERVDNATSNVALLHTRPPTKAIVVMPD